MSSRGGFTPMGSRRWTRGQLKTVLTVAFGAGRGGGPDTAAAAAALGVSARTVQRYVHGPARGTAPVPARRLEQIRRVVRPDPESLRQEQIADRYARDAIARIAEADGVGVLTVWQERRWLEPHVVAVLDLPALGLRQVTITRGSDRALHALWRRGKLLAYLTVPTRFHATVLAHELLQHLDDWRVAAPAGTLPAGRTQTWLRTAPAARLPEMAAHHELT